MHAHERADQVQHVLVIGAVHAQPGDVVQQQRLGAVVADRRGDLADQVRQVHVLGVGAVEPQDGLAGALGLGGHRGLHVGDRGVQVTGPGQRIGVEVVVQVQPGVLEAGGDLAGGLGLALVAAAGDHHPGAGGRLVLERVGLDPAAQHPGHGLAHRGLLQREVGVRGGPVQVIEHPPPRRQRPPGGPVQPRRGRERAPGGPPLLPAGQRLARRRRSGKNERSRIGASAMCGPHRRSCPALPGMPCGPPGSSSGRRSMLPWRRASRISGAGSGLEPAARSRRRRRSASTAEAASRA